jgi:hypothetical protein
VTKYNKRLNKTTYSKPKPNPTQTYIIFENQRNTKIHKTSCQEYQTRKADSKHNKKGLQIGTWHGPYPTIMEALEKAAKTGKPIRHCSKCIKTT